MSFRIAIAKAMDVANAIIRPINATAITVLHPSMFSGIVLNCNS